MPPVPERGYEKTANGLFIRAWSNRISDNGLKLEKRRFRVDVKNKFFTIRVVEHWNCLSREIVEAPYLDIPEVMLDKALSNLIWWRMSLMTAEELD